MIDAAEIAKQLILAEQEHRAIAPFTHLNPELDIDTAYAAQRIVVQARLDNGERIIGAKLGLTSRVKQKAMGVDSPLFGPVTDRMIAPFGEPIALDELIHPRVEPEIAFVLARDVAAPATVSSVLAATEVVCGAVDVLDSRYEDYLFTLPDVIADNASAGRFLLGPNQLAPSAIDDLRLLGCVRAAERWRCRDGGGRGGHGPSGRVGGVAGESAGRARRSPQGRMDHLLGRPDRSDTTHRGQRDQCRVRRTRHHRGVRRVASTTTQRAATTRRGR